jgi:hypothetical protein
MRPGDPFQGSLQSRLVVTLPRLDLFRREGSQDSNAPDRARTGGKEDKATTTDNIVMAVDGARATPMPMAPAYAPCRWRADPAVPAGQAGVATTRAEIIRLAIECVGSSVKRFMAAAFPLAPDQPGGGCGSKRS